MEDTHLIHPQAGEAASVSSAVAGLTAGKPLALADLTVDRAAHTVEQVDPTVGRVDLQVGRGVEKM